MKIRETRRGGVANNDPAPSAKDMKTNRLFNSALIVLAFGLTCVFIVFGAYFQTDQDFREITVGEAARDNIFAPRDFVVEHATEERRLEARARADGQRPSMSLDPQIWLNVEHNLHLLKAGLTNIREFYALEIYAFEQAQAAILDEYQAARERYNADVEEWEFLRDIAETIEDGLDDLPPRPETPVTPEPLEPEFEAWAMFEPLPFHFTEIQQDFLLHLDDYAYEHLWEVVIEVAYALQSTPIDVVDTRTQTELRSALGVQVLDQDTRDIIEDIVWVHLTPNQIVDEEETRRQWEITAANYEPVRMVQNQIIVGTGAIITEEIFSILEQLDMLEETTIGDIALSISGAFLIVVFLFIVCLMYLSFYRPAIAMIKKEAFLLFTLYVLVISLVWFLRDFSYPFLPILIFPMLVSVLIERRCALVLSFSMTLACYFIVAGTWDFLMFFIIAGMIIAMLSRFTTDRSKIFLVGLAVMLLQLVLSVSIAFIMDLNQALYSIPDLLITAGFAAVNGLLVVIISTGSLPIWETFFGVVTPVKLLDLTNPTNLLLRRLTIEAPGTYHHSLIVANLAETAAYDIGANAHAARVGGYYHDIGKLKLPHYFAENLDKDNPHDHLEPIQSADLIIGHVSFGLNLAAEHRLPQFVRDIIQEHHGTTLLQFFYHKAVEAEGQADEEDYRYPFIIPQTRESACVMLADSVEAAIRSMMPKIKSANEMENKIRKIVRDKLNDGQLADSQLSIRDVTTIEESFIRVLKGMYHERIPYPKLVPVEEAESVISASDG